MTPQIFNDIKRVVSAGHTGKSARKATNSAINAKYKEKITRFITNVINQVDTDAKAGFSETTVLIPDFDNLSRDVEHLLTEHLTLRKFDVTPDIHNRKLKIKW